MIFFTDENVSRRFAPLLEAFERQNQIQTFDAHFGKGTPDTQWIANIAKWTPKPVVIGGDGRILTNPAERAVLKKAGLTFVLLAPGWTNLPWEEQAWKIIKVWPQIVRSVKMTKKPTVFRVTPRGPKIEHKCFVEDLGRTR